MNNQNQKNKKVALVSGGNRGIGKEIARQLALQGYHVLIGCRDVNKGQQAVEEMCQYGLQIDLQAVDVNDSDSVKQMIDRIKKEYARLDVLVNNAGILKDFGISVLEVEESVVKETFETNFFGALRMTQAIVPLMKQQKYGRIVNLSSGLGAFEVLQGLGGFKGSSPAYRISKTMLNALTCLIAQEVDEWGIKVNAVCPGRVKTDMAVSDTPRTFGGISIPSSTVEEGADTAVWLATLDEQGPNGGYFRDRQPIDW